MVFEQKKYFKLLTPVIGIIFFIIFSKSFYVAGFDAYGIGDMLINYQCGFVRRGLIGTFFLELSDLSGLNVIKLINWATYFLYLIVLGFIGAKLLKKPFLFLFIVLSPIGYFFIINHWLAFAKKDVYLLFFFILCLYSYSIKVYWLHWLILICLIVFAVLLHEGFIFLSMPFIFLFHESKYTIGTSWASRVKFGFVKLAPLILLTSILTASIFYFTSRNNVIEKADCMEVQYKQVLGVNAMSESSKHLAIYAIGWLKSDLKRAISETSANYLDSKLQMAIFIDILFASISIFSLILFSTGSLTFTRIPFLYPISFIFLLIAFTVIFYIAIDWGRWLHLIFMHATILLIFLQRNCTSNQNRIKRFIFLYCPILICGMFNSIPVYYRSDSLSIKTFPQRVLFKKITF